MTKGEPDVICDFLTWPVPLVVYCPAVCITLASLNVTGGYSTCFPDRCCDFKTMDQCCPTSPPCPFRDKAVLENLWCFAIQYIWSKYVHYSRKETEIYGELSNFTLHEYHRISSMKIIIKEWIVQVRYRLIMFGKPANPAVTDNVVVQYHGMVRHGYMLPCPACWHCPNQFPVF